MRAPVATVYLAVAGVAAAGFAAVGALLATTLPYHEWDSFGFGEWSRAIAEHGKFDPIIFGPLTASLHQLSDGSNGYAVFAVDAA